MGDLDMADKNKGSKKPKDSGKGGSGKPQQGSGDFPHLGTMLQHGLDKDGQVYRGSNGDGSRL